MTDWKAEAEAHARTEYPREACGLVVVFKGRERYWPCRNQAVGQDHFILAPEDWADAEEAGEIVAVWHSHCNIGPDPSQADLVSCEATGLPWHIYALPADRWHTFQPGGYRAPLVGREFSHGVLDCYTLIRDWYAQERGITLPDFERHDDWWLRGENLYMENFGKAGFVPVESPSHGDVILMQIGARVANHGGIWLEGDMILHHLHGRLSSRDVYGEFFRRNTVKVLRYAA